MSRPDVFVLCRSKRSNRNASATLEQALVERGIKAYRVTPNTNPKWDPSRIHTVINHGVSDTPIWADRLPDDVVWFNSPMTVKLSANKALMTEALQQAGVPCLDSTHNRFTAEQWAEQGHTVVSRTELGGSKGSGIVLSPPDPLPECELYTKLFAGHRVREYRAYIVDGKMVDLIEKRRKGRQWYRDHDLDRESPYTTLIRSNGNGWAFARNTTELNGSETVAVERVAERAARAIGMGWGGVDLILNRCTYEDQETLDIYGEHINEIRVVETNTSIGIYQAPRTTEVLGEALAAYFEYERQEAA